ncbi:hypothetical protein [Halomonas salinarum]|uniref:hypothetical protein n=1 Tax=Halomonas salinarum TaxID=1158993 RepID=UPI00143C5454|nr:hypothetical protein [Halomonas salinarum]
MSDQAAGLRRWAQSRQASEEAASGEAAVTSDASDIDAAIVDNAYREGHEQAQERALGSASFADRADSAEATDPQASEPAVPERASSEGKSGEITCAGDEPEPRSEPAAVIPLMVLGLPRKGGGERAQAALVSWSRQGKRWVGDPAAWQVVACDAHSPHLAQLARQEKRWALWVDTDGDGFRQAFKVMQAIRRGGGPRRLLALHPPVASRRGLLNNLQQMAREAFEIDLLVLAP